MSQITIQDLSFTYEGDHIPVFQHLDLQLDTRWKLGLVGRNGWGKTTLLRLLEGSLSGSGALTRPDRPVYFPRPVDEPERPAREVLMEGIPWEEEWMLLRELNRLGLSEEILEQPFSSLSGGEQTRAGLARLFCQEDGYPMLDEPTNHLDEAGRDLTARYLRGLDRGFLLVSHDRAFLDACTDHTLALNRTGPEVVKGNFSVWYQEKERRDQRETAQNEALRGEIRRLEQASRRTSLWSDRVEQSKYGSQNSGLRPDRGYLGHKSAKLMQRAKNLEVRQQRAIQEKTALLQDVERADSLKLIPLRHHSQRLLEGRDLVVLHGGRSANRPASFTLEQGQRLCLRGGNGSGKTSLLRLVLGEELEHTGSLRRTSGLVVSYVPQQVGRLRGCPAALAEERGLDRTQFFTVLRKLDFSRPMLERDMAEYSAGQQKKLLLAASLCQSAHLYVWDEPLNYIDLFSRIQMEELILEYQPTMLLVEHDRAFCGRLGTDVLVLDAEQESRA